MREALSLQIENYGEKKFHDPMAAVCHLHPEIATWVKAKIFNKESEWGAKLDEHCDDIIVDVDRKKFIYCGINLIFIMTYFISELLPSFLGFISESIEKESSRFRQQLFENLIRRQPILPELWEQVMNFLFDVAENETVINEKYLSEESEEFKEKIRSWDQFINLKNNISELIRDIPETWHINYHGQISHPDTHGPEETFQSSIYEFFGHSFRDERWDSTIRKKVPEKFSKWIGSGYTNIFKNRHAVIPVIHSRHTKQSLNSAKKAFKAGCDGVFIINAGVPHQKLFEICDAIKNKLPELWLGINCLDVHPKEIFSLVPSCIDGIWVDNAMINETSHEQEKADEIFLERLKCGWKGLYFGGTAFKYQEEVYDASKVASIASRYMDVVTTSGPGTGQAADPEKIKKMKSVLGNFPLAIASGITPDNVSAYKNYANCFLVATGISKNFYELDDMLIRELLHEVRK